MKITPANPHTYDYSRLLLAMHNSGDADNLSLNPCLPAIIGRTMHWPFTALLFETDHTPVAWFAALFTGKEWFSLPHFNNGAYWFHEKEYNTWLGGGQAQHLDKSGFYNHYILNGEWFNVKPTEDRLLVISLSAEYASVPVQQSKTAISLKTRAYSALSEHRLSHKVDSQLLLKKESELQLAALTAPVRRKTGKAARNGISLQTGGPELLSAFYEVYREKIHELGSFALPVDFFERLLKEYTNGDIRLLIASYKGRPIGSAVLMSFGQYAENPWFATLKSYNHLYVSYLLHWEMIKHSIAAGCSLYSFGYSTKGSSVHKYKQQWGVADRIIFLNSSEEITDGLAKKQYLRRVIKIIPMPLVRYFDRFIAGRYY